MSTPIGIALKLANSGQGLTPLVNLNFGGSTLDSRITFTRASSATRVNSSGLIESVAAGVPRFDYDPITLACRGLLIEESRTNLLTYSQEFDVASVWVPLGASISANTTTAPDGTTTADKLVESTANTFHYVSSNASVSAGSVTASIYVKAAGRTAVQLNVSDGTNTVFCRFDLSAGTFITNATINSGTAYSSPVSTATSVGNGWYRISIGVATTVGAATTFGIYCFNGASSYTGDGTSGLFLWGAQLEAGAFPTSYVPTTTTSATRAAEVAVMTGTNFSSWYRADEGTFVCTFDSTATSGTAVPIGVATTGVFNESMYVSRGGSGAVLWSITDNGAAQFVGTSLGTASSATAFNVAASYKLNDSAAVGNGGTVVTDTACTLPTVDRLSIGDAPWGAGSNQMNGHIRSIRYFPAKLSSAQLQALTL